MGREFSVDDGFDASDYGQLSKSEVARQEGRASALFSTQEAEIAGIIKDILGEEVTSRDQRFAEDLKADSLDFVEIVMALEEHFEIEIADAEVQDVTTVAEVFTVIAGKTA